MVNNDILKKYLGKYIRIYMKDTYEDGDDVQETGFLEGYDKDTIELVYPPFIKKSPYCGASGALIPRSNIKYIDVLFKKTYTSHKKDYKQFLEDIKSGKLDEEECDCKSKHMNSHMEIQ